MVSSQLFINGVTLAILNLINKMNNKLKIEPLKSQESSSEKRVKK